MLSPYLWKSLSVFSNILRIVPASGCACKKEDRTPDNNVGLWLKSTDVNCIQDPIRIHDNIKIQQQGHDTRVRSSQSHDRTHHGTTSCRLYRSCPCFTNTNTARWRSLSSDTHSSKLPIALAIHQRLVCNDRHHSTRNIQCHCPSNYHDNTEYLCSSIHTSNFNGLTQSP